MFRAGETFRLYTGTGTDSQTDLFWGRGSGVWNNDFDTVFVYDPDAHQVANRPYSNPPTVTSVNPVSGSAAGGNSVVIKGANFVAVTAVRFGTVDVVSFTVNSATQITAIAPAQSAGQVYVRVTTGGYLISTGGTYTYAAP